MKGEPFGRQEANRRIKDARAAGKFRFTVHASQRLVERDLMAGDILNVIRAGSVIREPRYDIEEGWTYAVETDRVRVVVAFCDDGEVRFVTCIRKD